MTENLKELQRAKRKEQSALCEVRHPFSLFALCSLLFAAFLGG